MERDFCVIPYDVKVRVVVSPTCSLVYILLASTATVALHRLQSRKSQATCQHSDWLVWQAGLDHNRPKDFSCRYIKSGTEVHLARLLPNGQQEL